MFARTVLRLTPNDLTGGFKAWRAATLAAIPFDGVHAGGYVFQIEMTFRASRDGARVREVPITFRDRRVGQSKMCRRIVVEALVVVVQLRADELRGRFTHRGPGAGSPIAARRGDVAAGGGLGRRDRDPRRARPRRPGARRSGPQGRVTAASAARLGDSGPVPRARTPQPGVRVVLDARPLQDPDRAPLTAQYLSALLAAYRRATRPGRVVRAPARVRRRRPDRAPHRARGRRATLAAADATAPLRRAHGRSVPAVRGEPRRGLAGRARRRGRGRLPRGRRVRMPLATGCRWS